METRMVGFEYILSKSFSLSYNNLFGWGNWFKYEVLRIYFISVEFKVLKKLKPSGRRHLTKITFS